jgi:hypothetical protein
MKVIRERLRASVARESITLQLSMKEAWKFVTKRINMHEPMFCDWFA